MVELSAAVQHFVDEPRFAVLATLNGDGSVQQSVMWYERVGAEILMNTTSARTKARNLARDCRASLCIEDGYRFVTLAGRIVRTIEDQAVSRRDILRLGVRYDGQAEADRQMHELWSHQVRLTLYMSIDRVVSAGFKAAPC
jgi:PPOX class probable F420-dependent enzyme